MLNCLSVNQKGIIKYFKILINLRSCDRLHGKVLTLQVDGFTLVQKKINERMFLQETGVRTAST